MEIPIKASYTREDYERLPENAPYELIAGQLIMSPSPTPLHQIVSRNLLIRLHLFIEKHELGSVIQAPIDVKLSEKTILVPDLLFIRQGRLAIIGKQYVEGPPDLVVEVLSPSNAYYDLRKKKRLYEEHGVQEYWIADPEEQSIEVYSLIQGSFQMVEDNPKDGLVSSRVINDLKLQVRDIFKP